MEDCLFCKIINKEIPSEVIYEDDNIFAFLDINPINDGHTLIIPKKHSKDLTVANDEDLHYVISKVKELAPKICKAVGANDFNLGVNNGPTAGQVVFHTHFHIMPRFDGDGHRHWHGQKLSDEKAKEIAEKIKKEL